MQAICDRPGSHWYAVQTKTRAEDKAVTFLRGRDVSVFLPRLLVHRRHGSRRWQSLEPLFPGYLFVRVTPEPHVIDRVRWTPGVTRILGDGDAPIPVPEDAVRFLQQRVGDRGFVVPGPIFVPGVRVRFTEGPLAHLAGIIERRMSGPDRVRVLLELLHTNVSVEADVNLLERV